MTIARHFLAAASVASLAVAVAGPACAGAFYIQEQSVKGLGRAYSGEGADTGVDSMWWNPASIAQIQGVEFYNAIHAVYPTGEVRNGTSTLTQGGVARPVGGEPTGQNPILVGYVPNGGAAWRINDRISIGLVATAPFNFTTKYSDRSFVRYDALKSRLFSVDVQPTVAVHVARWLDIGVGFDAQYVNSTLTNALPNLLTGPDGDQRLSGEGWDFGYTVGAQVHPDDRFTIGLSYRSAIDHTLDGSVDATAYLGTIAVPVSGPGKAKFTTPWIATLSGRYKVTDKLTLNAQVERVGWSEFKSIDVTSTAIPGGALSTPERYQSITNGGVGLDYAVNPRWTMRTGVQFDPTPVRDSNRSARVPDSDRYLVGVGTTVQVTKRLSVDLAGAYIHFDDTVLNTTTVPPAGFAAAQLNGTVSGEGVVLSGGAHYRF